MHIAAKMGNFDIIQMLIIKNFNINLIDAFSRTPIMVAASRGHSQIVSLLLTYDANININDSIGRNIIHIAALCNSFITFEILINKNSNLISLLDNKNRTILHQSIFNKTKYSLDIAKMALSYNIEINVCDNENKTALYYASETNKHDIILYLLEHGANPFVVSNNKNCIDAAGSDETRALILKNINNDKQTFNMEITHNMIQ